MKTFYGKTVNGGIAVAPTFVLDRDILVSRTEISDSIEEIKRLNLAKDAVLSDLEAHKSSSDIIEIHIMLLSDSEKESLISRTQNYIETESVNSEYALNEMAGIIAEEFSQSSSSYLNARSEDIFHIKNMLLNKLADCDNDIQIEEPSIIITSELSPEDLLSISPDLIKGLITVKGSPLSHTAIVAKSLNIPYLTGVDPDVTKTDSGVISVIKADDGMFIYDATGDVVCDGRRQEERALREKALREEALKERALKEGALKEGALKEGALKARDGKNNLPGLIEKCPIKLCANIGKPSEAATAAEYGALGIGLFRSEFLYMESDEAPDEETQYEAYVKACDAMGGKPVIVRTFDIGADKNVKYLKMPSGADSSPDSRGISISFTHPELFMTQLRALLRASYGRNLKIMFPMITSYDEVVKAKEYVNKAAMSLKDEGIEYAVPSIGIMVETPEAVTTLDSLAPLIDFVSIGTNDLTQYALGLDRLADNFSEYYDPHSETVLSLIRITVETAHRHNIEAGICGELGRDTSLASFFLEIGIDELSMAPSGIPEMAAALDNESK